jgi:hypothetical protein
MKQRNGTDATARKREAALPLLQRPAIRQTTDPVSSTEYAKNRISRR